MTAPAAVSWAAYLGWINLSASPIAFLGYSCAPWILTVLALGELVADKLPSTPGRKVPLQFSGRLVLGGLSGAALGVTGGSLAFGAVTGIVGAIVGTFSGAEIRSRLAAAVGKNLPAALAEDVFALLGALLIVLAGR
ncbi:DUF4126 domain-containing protein [Bosea sp. BK604]|uniref:DUF4126 domain-containing protein n=1 Tax=Bosea sp. BK604 TaxID=2512180 RepID=UPI00104A4E61|nr:DUF4126 domain-containing protein [Bosea sp. BK604]